MKGDGLDSGAFLDMRAGDVANRTTLRAGDAPARHTQSRPRIRTPARRPQSRPGIQNPQPTTHKSIRASKTPSPPLTPQPSPQTRAPPAPPAAAAN